MAAARTMAPERRVAADPSLPASLRRAAVVAGGQRLLLGASSGWALAATSTALRRRANRGFLTVEAKKKGFAELLSDIVLKDEDYNGRPRLEKGKERQAARPTPSRSPPYADTGHLRP